METECSERSFEFQPLAGRQVTARFNGGTITSEMLGALLLGEIEAGSGLMAKMAALLRRSPRIPRRSNTRSKPCSSNVCLLWRWGTRISTTTINSGPIRCWRCSWESADPTGQDRADPRAIVANRWRARAALNRLELTPVGKRDVGHRRYKKIVARHRDLEKLVCRCVSVTDLEPASGDRFWTWTRPMIRCTAINWAASFMATTRTTVTCRCISSAASISLRKCQAAAVRHRCGRRFGETIGRGLVERIRSEWPCRCGSSFVATAVSAEKTLMCWCEDNGVDYVLGLAKNQRLTRILGKELYESQCVCLRPTGKCRLAASRTSTTARRRAGARGATRGGQGRTSGQSAPTRASWSYSR